MFVKGERALAAVYWQLGHLRRSRSDLQIPYIVSRETVVYDMDEMGWDKGIRAGMPVSEVKWQYPEAAVIPWRSEDYQKTYQDICMWLEDNVSAYSQPDLRGGYWDWPEMDEEQWQQLTAEVSTRWALRMDTGIALHPVLAEWAAKEGRQYPHLMDHWTYRQQNAYVVTVGDEKKIWNALPLKYLPNVARRTMQDWNKQGWMKVGDVPHLYSTLDREFGSREAGKREPIRVKKTFDAPICQGIPDLVRVLAGEVAQKLMTRHQGSRHLRITWREVETSEVCERTWSTPTESTQQVITRFLTLLAVLPHSPPDQLILEAQQPEDLDIGQLTWWPSYKSHRATPSSHWAMPVSRRNMLLQYWDPWRVQSTTK
jgi:hypothetical protein